jgi:hypothetical protein
MAQDFQPAGLAANLTDAGSQVGPNQVITVGPEQVITLKRHTEQRGVSLSSSDSPVDSRELVSLIHQELLCLTIL